MLQKSGTFTAQDAYDKISAGASLVGMITGLIFEGPQVVGDINAGLSEFLEKDGHDSVRAAVGTDSRLLQK
jgi:dihydroorotate dehydrogenase